MRHTKNYKVLIPFQTDSYRIISSSFQFIIRSLFKYIRHSEFFDCISSSQLVSRLATQTYFIKMFKLVVLFALVAVAVAKPSLGLGYSAFVAPVAALPSAVTHTYRADIISKPVVTAYAAAPAFVSAPIIAKSYVAAPLAVPAAISHTYRRDFASKPVIAAYAAPALTYAAHVPAIHAW